MKLFSEISLAPDGCPTGIQSVPLNAQTVSQIEVAVCSRATARQLATLPTPALKLVQLTSAGWDDVPVNDFAQRGIAVANAAGIYSIPIAETVVMGMLLMAKRLRRNPNQRRPRWRRQYHLIEELADKSVMILGAGNIGQAIARRLAGFDMTVHGYDLHADPPSGFSRIYTRREELKTVISAYQYVIITLPATPDTIGFFNREWFQRLNENCVLIHVGRPPVVVAADLLHALRTRRVKGAVLDQFEWLPHWLTNPFRRRPNVIVLPGVAAISKESKVRLQQLIARNLQRVKNHQTPVGLIPPDAPGR